MFRRANRLIFILSLAVALSIPTRARADGFTEIMNMVKYPPVLLSTGALLVFGYVFKPVFFWAWGEKRIASLASLPLREKADIAKRFAEDLSALHKHILSIKNIKNGGKPLFPNGLGDFQKAIEFGNNPRYKRDPSVQKWKNDLEALRIKIHLDTGGSLEQIREHIRDKFPNHHHMNGPIPTHSSGVIKKCKQIAELMEEEAKLAETKGTFRYQLFSNREATPYLIAGATGTLALGTSAAISYRYSNYPKMKKEEELTDRRAIQEQLDFGVEISTGNGAAQMKPYMDVFRKALTENRKEFEKIIHEAVKDNPTFQMQVLEFYNKKAGKEIPGTQEDKIRKAVIEIVDLAFNEERIKAGLEAGLTLAAKEHIAQTLSVRMFTEKMEEVRENSDKFKALMPRLIPQMYDKAFEVMFSDDLSTDDFEFAKSLRMLTPRPTRKISIEAFKGLRGKWSGAYNAPTLDEKTLSSAASVLTKKSDEKMNDKAPGHSGN